MKIKAVLFDLDNTLVDFVEMKRKCCEQAARAMIDSGLDMKLEDACDKLHKTYWEVGIESDTAFTEFLKRTIGKVDDKILAAAINAYLRTKNVLLEPYPNVISTLTKLTKKGIVIGIVTDAPRLKAWQRLNAMKIHNLFDIVITPDDAGGRKTSQLPFKHVVKKLKMKPNEILFVGDSIERDMKGAKKIGMITALAKYSSNEKADPKIVDFVLSDIKEILRIIER